MTPRDFYDAVYSTAIGLGANDVQARLAAAQASEETGYGKSMVGNNLFGIKAGSNYTGPSVTASTQEEYDGNTVRENASFRAYDDFTQSVKDYLGVVQQNFPDAWSAESFPEAVKGLNTGVYGKYATRAAYGQHIKAIDNKYGGYSYAANPSNVPTPYGPNEEAPDFAVADDVLPMADPNFTAPTPGFEYAANLSNVPTPEQRPATPPSLTAFSDQAQQERSPFDAVLGGKQPGEWGVINGVGPVYTPTINQWSDMAAAGPITAPMGSVTAQGLLGANPGLQASATAGLLDQATPSERMGLAEPGFDMSRFDGAAPSIASGFDPSRFASAPFDPSRFGPGLVNPATNTQSFLAPPVDANAVAALGVTPGLSAVAVANPQAAAFDASRFASDPTTSRIGTSQVLGDMARMNPLTGAIDPATNTQSFRDQPADLGNMPDAYAAQRGPSTGILSAEHQMRVADVMRQMQNPSLMAQQPSLNVPASGLLGGVPGLEAQATANVPTQTAGLHGGVDQAAAAERPNSVIADPGMFAAPNFNQAMNPSVPALSMPSVQMAQTPAVDPTTTGSTTPGLLSPGLMSEARPTLTSTPSNRILSEQPINQVGFVPSLASNVDINLSGNIVPAAEIAAPPALETVQVAEQPNVAAQETIPGPATTAIPDQQTQAVTTPAVTTRTTPATQNKGLLSGLLSKETAIGGGLGALAFGPLGGVLGALAGQQVARSGGLSSLLGSSSFMAPTNQIAGGVSNIASLYGGAYAPGTFAIANNGATITAQPGGYTTYENKYGVVESVGPDGKIGAYFGGGADTDEDSQSSGGIFGGLFG